jgi:hypothetical protein
MHGWHGWVVVLVPDPRGFPISRASRYLARSGIESAAAVIDPSRIILRITFSRLLSFVNSLHICPARSDSVVHILLF